MNTNAHILTINAGSSSIKFSLFQSGKQLVRCVHGSIQWLRFPQITFTITSSIPGDSSTQILTANNRSAAVVVLLDWLLQQHQRTTITAVGHRIVHGGANYFVPQLLSETLLCQLDQLCHLDPEHLPQEIELLRAMQTRFPQVPQVACFDTAFHHDLPRVAQLLPIPRHYEKSGVRRYGFHGLSYAWLMEELARLDGSTAAQGRVILAHLGNGVSLAAVHKGQPVDTSMGFTPAAGVLMGTRSGDLDPGLISYLMNTQAMSASQFNQMVNSQSGLLGISETSSDMRELLACEAKDVRAAEAIAMFCYQIRKCIGAYAAALGGLDTLIFAGGIGENLPLIRERICQGLEFLGIKLDPEQNAANANLISSADARVRTHRIPTDEEQMIARSTKRVLATNRQKTTEA